MAMVTRDSVDAPFGPKQILGPEVSLADWFPSGVPLAVVPAPYQRFAIADDELSIYFGNGSATGGLFQSDRSSLDAPFGDIFPRGDLGDDEALGAGWLSPDRCRLYCDVTVAGSPSGPINDIVVAERQP